MSEIPVQENLVALCPHCRKAYAIKSSMVGRQVNCKQCRQSFCIEVASAPPLASPSRESPRPPPDKTSPPATGAILCPVCQCALEATDTLTVCQACQTRHHQDCWEYNRGCGLYGCSKAPETEKLQEIEIPASFWGQTEKQCPRCGKTIQAAAVRCRFCTLEFTSARPQAASEFQSNVEQANAIARHRKIGIVLLIMAIIPCTSPLALIAGLPWYFLARKHIAAMPGLHAAICRMVVIIAISVTSLMLVIAAIYSAFK